MQKVIIYLILQYKRQTINKLVFNANLSIVITLKSTVTTPFSLVSRHKPTELESSQSLPNFTEFLKKYKIHDFYEF